MDQLAVVRQDNQGATLVTVILCIAFISILGSILMSTTAINLKMKQVNQKTTHNFYDTESALDEIKTGLEEIVAAVLEDAYEETMEQYITKSGSERKQIFKKAFIDGLTIKLGGALDARSYNKTLLSSYIRHSPAMLDVPEGDNILTRDSSDPSQPEFITLMNVTVSYKDANNYKTSISSDIVINVPDFNFDDRLIDEPIHMPAFSSYGLIGDRMISLDAAQNVETVGNVYAGAEGIFLTHGSQLHLYGAKDIVTRGDIQIAERSSLEISGNPSIWATNISTQKGSNTTSPTRIKINGKIYVADDLMLNANYSDVTIDGEFYGYSYHTAKADLAEDEINSAENSSAIIINGTNSKLDMENTDTLLIAGRAYLDPSSRDNTSGMEQGKVYTGESLAIKGNQYAYLIPAEYIWCGSNPVSFTDYLSKPDGVPEVDYSKNVEGETINLLEYVDGYSKIFYQSGSQNLVYYYLRFSSEEKANAYLREYYNTNNPETEIGAIDNLIKGYGNSIKVKQPINSIISAGNIFTFKSETGKSSLIPNSINPDTDPDGNKNEAMERMGELTANLASRYDNIRLNLTDIDSGVPHDPNSLFRSIVNIENLEWDANYDGQFNSGIKKVLVGTDYVVYIVDNAGGAPFVIPDDATLPGRGRQGMVIASGSVRVNNNYTGLILSGDQIILNSGVKISASENIIKSIINDHNPGVNRYLRGYEGLTARDTGDDEVLDNKKVIISDLIVYDNWQKNNH